jgi:DNA-binding MurR/RpiR family transcriptional regulator
MPRTSDPHDSSSLTASERIREGFEGLSPALQHAARYVLDHANEVVILSMRSLSVQAQMPSATLVRLAQALGYAGWRDIKAAFAKEWGLANDSASYSVKAKTLIERGHAAEHEAPADAQLLQELMQAQIQNLQAIAKRNASALRSTARLLIAAPRVHIAGFRASYPLAYELAYLYRLFRDTVHLLDGHAGGLEMQLRQLQPNDVVVVIGFEPCSSESVRVAESARHNKCQLIAITDSEASPLSLLAQHRLLFSAQSPSFFPSITAGMAVVEALIERVLAQSEPEVIQRIKLAEQALHASGAYMKRKRI